eukprot:GGOE01009787.1.p1 GENE.GGOE01009787.1~~GGOE01009787.1.p1  ORF type:complete len:441 (+),score=131.17 GGOE01009787.1:48-1325(+)
MSPDELRATGPLFREWSDALLEAFIAEQQLMAFAQSECICHQGDPCDWLYVLVEGTVDVVMRPPDAPGKARGKRTGVTVARLQPGEYIGEYGVFAGEQRAATLYCTSVVVVWVASKESFVRHLKEVPVPVYQQITASFEERMADIHRVNPAQLASTALFQDWDTPTLEQVVARLQPVFFTEQTVIIAPGSPGTALYIVATGRCAVMQAGQPVEVTAEAMLGMRSCVFLEPNENEVRATTTVQAWRLARATLLDFMLRRPDRFLEAKARLNEEAARALRKPTPQELLGDCALSKLPPAGLRRVYARLQPVVYAAHDVVVTEGQPVDCLLFVTSGHCSTSSGVLPHQGLCLGVEEVVRGCARWDQRVVAQERVEGWRITLPDVLEALEGWRGSSRHRALQLFLENAANMSVRRSLPGEELESPDSAI